MVTSYRRAWHSLASDKGELPSPFACSNLILPLPKSKWNEDLGCVSLVAPGEQAPEARNGNVFPRKSDIVHQALSSQREAVWEQSIPSPCVRGLGPQKTEMM